MQIKDLLKGYRPGTLQAVGIMKVLPILTDNVWQDIGEFKDIYIKSDPEYGNMVMGSKSDKITIIPHGIAFMTKEYCQDRTIPVSHVIMNSKKCNANCIQDSQCGHFQPDQMREARFIPRTLMLPAWQKVNNNHSYDNIWDNIRKYNKEARIQSNAWMVNFFNKFDNELQEFVAQFEVEEKQVGAFVFLNDNLVGVELVPNYEIWKQVWRPLIRDCYGSDCISLIKKDKTGKVCNPVMNLDDINNIDDIELAYKKIKEQIKDFTKGYVNEFIEKEVSLIEDHHLQDYHVKKLTNGSYIGDVITHGSEHVIYLSVLNKKDVTDRVRTTISKSLWENTDKDPYQGTTSFEFN